MEHTLIKCVSLFIKNNYKLKKEKMMKLISLLPFMDKEEIKGLAQKIINKEVTGVSLVVLFPFLDTEDLDELVDDLIKNGSTKQIYHALPFLSKKSINTLYEKVKNGEIKGFREQALLPFLGKSAIKDMFDTLVKEASEKATEEDPDVDMDELFDEEE